MYVGKYVGSEQLMTYCSNTETVTVKHFQGPGLFLMSTCKVDVEIYILFALRLKGYI